MRVCDKCGKPAAQNFELDAAGVDLCRAHVDELKMWLYGPKPLLAEQRATPDSSSTLTLKGRNRDR